MTIAVDGSIDRYMTRLRSLAEECDHIDRFFLFQDEDLYDLEYELANSDESQLFYDTLMDQFRAWRDEMGPEKWAEVVARNDSSNGANQNWLLDEL